MYTEKAAEAQVVFRWHTCQKLNDYMDYAIDRVGLVENSLFYITGGQAVWQLNDQEVILRSGIVVGLPAGTWIEPDRMGTFGLEGWVIEFRQFELKVNNEKSAEIFQSIWHLPNHREFLTGTMDGRQIRDQLQALSMLADEAVEKEVRCHQVLYTLLDILYQPVERAPQTTEQAILQSIKYLEQYYYKPITRNELAKVAGLSPWHYSRKFRALTDKAPLEYLNRYRIYRAKERLIQNDGHMHDIAKQVGFEDAAYFSRRFKQMEGISPKHYVQVAAERQLCALSPLYAEILLALGVVPNSVVTVPMLLPPHQRLILEKHNVNMIPTSQYALDLEAIAEVKPQLIVGHTLQGEARSALMSISPFISGLSRDLIPAIAQLAAVFRKEEEAENLYRYLKKIDAQARERLKTIIQERRTVMVLRIEEDSYRYLGAHSLGLSRMIYRELGLTIPTPLNRGQYWFNPLDIETLPAIDPNFIFLEDRVMEGSDTRLMKEVLMKHPSWNRLAAVKNNRVYTIDTSLWIGCGPFGYPLVMEQIVAALTNEDSTNIQII
ncbi:helix-turn-helix domain-containing protein [Paenibacillus sp. HW567]|uniref:helix-turn-helix domain-containing protein n=1 Tax=Paenibacillus sp. HW567 TaxID=1034769 RepID=UPI0018DD0F8A|nr:helix-turn-helix domain-containing protein [Paenibacillus sp. HW567]